MIFLAFSFAFPRDFSVGGLAHRSFSVGGSLELNLNGQLFMNDTYLLFYKIFTIEDATQVFTT